MKYKIHGFQMHPGYEDCSMCQNIINSVLVLKHKNGTIDIWNNESDKDDIVNLKPYQLSELKRKLNSMEEIK